MSRRLEIAVYVFYRSEMSTENLLEFTDNYVVTKKDGRFYITEKGEDDPFLEVDCIRKWIEQEMGISQDCEIRLKLLDGDKVVSSAEINKDWEQIVIYLSNLL